MEMGTNTEEIIFPISESRKRLDRTSPIPSPLKFTRSPAPKIRRRIRTGTEQKAHEPPVLTFESKWQTCQRTHPELSLKDKTLADFKLSEEELMALQEIHGEINTYMFHRLAVSNTESESTFLNIQDYFQ